MVCITPFGHLPLLPHIDTNRINAVLRALHWCETLLESTLWTPATDGTSMSLQRTMNGQRIELFPLEAALMDLGMNSQFQTGHLPIRLNAGNACVRSFNTRPRPLHTDMIASMILLLGTSEVDPVAVPRTLRSILTAEQRASLPPPRRREPYVAGRPSTSGREFLPESQVLELSAQHQNVVFTIQFEMRNGNLRNMIAREEVLMETKEDNGSPQVTSAGMSYNPSDYHLKTVFDMQREGYRNIATDRVTKITIGGHTYSTASAQDDA